MPGGTVTSAELVAHCRAVASRYKVPDSIEVRDALPVTATGKLMRRDLKQIAIEQHRTQVA
jgi:acyl-coenzyme A synthetase/AMP-(fatty) acid ligase